jgi:hypothetical protein
MHLKLLRDLHLLPSVFGTDWSGVFLQKFYGSVTVTPKPRLLDYVFLLSDPDAKDMARRISEGERRTWPSLIQIENRMRIERAIQAARRKARASLDAPQH